MTYTDFDDMIPAGNDDNDADDNGEVQ